MTKELLTKKQHAEVVLFKNKELLLEMKAQGNLKNSHPELHKMSLMKLSAALVNGYDIHEGYVKGDYVTVTEGPRKGLTFQITSIADCGSDYESYLLDKYIHLDGSFREATEKEITSYKWWEENGRQHWELNKGDILGRDCGRHLLYTVEKVTPQGLVYIRTPEDYAVVYSYEQLVLWDVYKVVAFADDRRDM